MGRHVLIVASGETERRAIPHLVRHLVGAEVRSVEVRISPHGVLTNPVAERITRAAWWELRGRGQPPDKVVVLVDADAQAPERKRAELAGLVERLSDLPVRVRIAVAKWHLEAWFFADAAGLRAWLGGRALGPIDPMPDAIESPKERLKRLLKEPYTSRTAERIAAAVSADVVRSTSPSYADFEAAVRNGSTR